MVGCNQKSPYTHGGLKIANFDRFAHDERDKIMRGVNVLVEAVTAGFPTGCRLSAICTAMETGCGWLSLCVVATRTVPPLALSGTRAISRLSVARTRLASASPKCTIGRAPVREANPLP